MELVISTLEQGMIYGIMALGVYITYKILDFPDLTVDGSFPMGAAITAVMITNGVPAILTLPVCFLVGALAGVLTGLIHVKLKVRDLLSGIIMMTALYTVNLRIAGRANLPFYKEVTVFDNGLVNGICQGALASWKIVLVMVVITVAVKVLLDAYLKTGSGFLLRAVGDNASIVTAMGRDRGKVKILGLAIANGLVTLSGCLFAQQQRCFEISVGTGTVVVECNYRNESVSEVRRNRIDFQGASQRAGWHGNVQRCDRINPLQSLRCDCTSHGIKIYRLKADYGGTVFSHSGCQHGTKGAEKCLNFPISINIIIRAQSMKCACFRILT